MTWADKVAIATLVIASVILMSCNSFSYSFGGYMNEPVALMTEYGIQPLHEGALQEGQFLYTHPVKELTDEEIKQIWLEFDARDTHDWFIAIARAILRKAK